VTRIEVEVDVAIDGAGVAGFPYKKTVPCTTMFSYVDRLVNPSIYVALLTGMVPATTAILRFIYITTDANLYIKINDTGQQIEDPILLLAGGTFCVVESSLVHIDAAPAILVKPVANPTNIQVVIGIE